MNFLKLQNMGVAELAGLLSIATQRARGKGVAISMTELAGELLGLLRGDDPAPSGESAGVGADASVAQDVTGMKFIHGRLGRFLEREDEYPEYGREELHLLYAAHDTLCWALGCRNRIFFGFAAAKLAAEIRKRSKDMAYASTPLDALTAQSIRRTGERFIYLRDPKSSALAIQCLTCLSVSHNGDDVANLFCGKCRVFHDELLAQDLAELTAQVEKSMREETFGEEAT